MPKDPTFRAEPIETTVKNIFTGQFFQLALNNRWYITSIQGEVDGKVYKEWFFLKT
jgi:hypothetical protein